MCSQAQLECAQKFTCDGIVERERGEFRQLLEIVSKESPNVTPLHVGTLRSPQFLFRFDQIAV